MSRSEDEHMIDLDPDSEDVESQYDSCYSSGSDCTTTIASEVTNFKWEHGRRYHSYSEGAYWGPNDEQQNNQLDLFHHIYTLILDGLFLAPIKDPKSVLDLGTGTGIWAIEFADAFPNAKVLGNDLSPVQPHWYPALSSSSSSSTNADANSSSTSAEANFQVFRIPANCSFEVDDFTKPWLHRPGDFDFVHARGLYGCVDDWPNFVDEVYHVLPPGGWFESVEATVKFYSDNYPGSELPPDSKIRKWTDCGVEASQRAGRKLDITGYVRPQLERRGYANVVEKVYKTPVGPWPKNKRLKMMGKWNLVNLLEACDGFTLALFTRYLGMSPEEARKMGQEAMDEMKDSKNRIFYYVYVTYGQRPESDTTDQDDMDVDSAYYSYM